MCGLCCDHHTPSHLPQQDGSKPSLSIFHVLVVVVVTVPAWSRATLYSGFSWTAALWRWTAMEALQLEWVLTDSCQAPLLELHSDAHMFLSLFSGFFLLGSALHQSAQSLCLLLMHTHTHNRLTSMSHIECLRHKHPAVFTHTVSAALWALLDKQELENVILLLTNWWYVSTWCQDQKRFVSYQFFKAHIKKELQIA